MDSFAQWHERFSRVSRERRVMVCRHLSGGRMEIRLYREVGTTIECVSLAITSNGIISNRGVTHFTVDWPTIFNSLSISRVSMDSDPLNFLIFAVEQNARTNPTDVEERNPLEEIEDPPDGDQGVQGEPQDHVEEDSLASYVDSEIFIDFLDFEDDVISAQSETVPVQVNENYSWPAIMREIFWGDPWESLPCTLIIFSAVCLTILFIMLLCRINFTQDKMENSAYVPNSAHLNSPALVVFSQAAGGLQDALRIQRPFNSQFAMSEASKDLHRPLTASSFGLRHMEAYSSIPAHILNHLQPQFLHPGLSLGSGAFRPLADLKSFPSPSAFAPPKCLKIETGNDSLHPNHSHGIFSPSEDRILGPSPRTDSCSPASASMSPQPQTAVKEESMDAQVSEDGDGHAHMNDNDSPGMHEENRGFRIGLFGGGFNTNGAYTFSLPPAAHVLAKTTFLFDHDFVSNKKKRDPSSCPVCGLTVTPGDLETHFMHELERLYKLTGTGIAATRKRNRPEPGRPPALPGDSGPEGRWETFQRIKTNRQGRLRIKIRKRKSDEMCPICTGHPHGTQEEINLHVERCVRKNNTNDEDETVDVEGDSELEEWHESQRRRTSSLVSGMTQNNPGRTTDVDNEGDDVIVDGDEPEESTFGPSQYSENDVVIKDSKDNEGVQSQVATVNSSGDVEVKVESGGNQQCDSNVSTSDAEPSSRAQIIEELRNRIRQLEAEGGGEPASSTDTEDYKCLICLEHYKKPVISTVCWHVHCEECWLHTLGSKKVCPQCSMITSPNDLRRIFM